MPSDTGSTGITRDLLPGHGTSCRKDVPGRVDVPVLAGAGSSASTAKAACRRPPGSRETMEATGFGVAEGPGRLDRGLVLGRREPPRRIRDAPRVRRSDRFPARGPKRGCRARPAERSANALCRCRSARRNGTEGTSDENAGSSDLLHPVGAAQVCLYGVLSPRRWWAVRRRARVSRHAGRTHPNVGPDRVRCSGSGRARHSYAVLTKRIHTEEGYV
ncbi:hypothetical protein HNR06_004641 [Nocardiopsis arvandica]|uniref:Uncharacterized protein n=1 Tax=Nocardiopsis sinuspersici TaxID=501010 RepID=A0A7Z0BMZ3_9ACTN|nr:hypothetical protein [Nocardiopsis sinuspersici]